jgi:hypothetical protein
METVAGSNFEGCGFEDEVRRTLRIYDMARDVPLDKAIQKKPLILSMSVFIEAADLKRGYQHPHIYTYIYRQKGYIERLCQKNVIQSSLTPISVPCQS